MVTAAPATRPNTRRAAPSKPSKQAKPGCSNDAKRRMVLFLWIMGFVGFFWYSYIRDVVMESASAEAHKLVKKLQFDDFHEHAPTWYVVFRHTYQNAPITRAFSLPDNLFVNEGYTNSWIEDAFPEHTQPELNGAAKADFLTKAKARVELANFHTMFYENIFLPRQTANLLMFAGFLGMLLFMCCGDVYSFSGSNTENSDSISSIMNSTRRLSFNNNQMQTGNCIYIELQQIHAVVCAWFQPTSSLCACAYVRLSFDRIGDVGPTFNSNYIYNHDV